MKFILATITVLLFSCFAFGQQTDEQMFNELTQLFKDASTEFSQIRGKIISQDASEISYAVNKSYFGFAGFDWEIKQTPKSLFLTAKSKQGQAAKKVYSFIKEQYRKFGGLGGRFVEVSVIAGESELYVLDGRIVASFFSNEDYHSLIFDSNPAPYKKIIDAMQNDLAFERKRVEAKQSAENAETKSKNKIAKEDPLLFQAYSEAIEKKNYQYISRILANKEFECVGCFTQTIKSPIDTNSIQFFDFAYFLRFGGLTDDPTGPFGAVFKTKLTYKVKIINEPEDGKNSPSLPGETFWQRGVKIRVKDDRLIFETVTPKGVYSNLLEWILANPDVIEGLKLDCDCENLNFIYTTVNWRTESFLYTKEATIKSINYQGRITLEMVDMFGQTQTFVWK